MALVGVFAVGCVVLGALLYWRIKQNQDLASQAAILTAKEVSLQESNEKITLQNDQIQGQLAEVLKGSSELKDSALRARIGQTASRSLLLLPEQPDLSLLLGIEAVRRINERDSQTSNASASDPSWGRARVVAVNALLGRVAAHARGHCVLASPGRGDHGGGGQQKWTSLRDSQPLGRPRGHRPAKAADGARPVAASRSIRRGWLCSLQQRREDDRHRRARRLGRRGRCRDRQGKRPDSRPARPSPFWPSFPRTRPWSIRPEARSTVALWPIGQQARWLIRAGPSGRSLFRPTEALVTGDSAREVKVWDLASGKEVPEDSPDMSQELKAPPGMSLEIRTLAYCPAAPGCWRSAWEARSTAPAASIHKSDRHRRPTWPSTRS